MPRTGFENLRVYGLAEEIADFVWDIVNELSPEQSSEVSRRLHFISPIVRILCLVI